MQTAYDYNTQEWVEGPAARALLIIQQTERLALLQGEQGDDYCQMIGADKAAEIANARTALASL